VPPNVRAPCKVPLSGSHCKAGKPGLYLYSTGERSQGASLAIRKHLAVTFSEHLKFIVEADETQGIFK